MNIVSTIGINAAFPRKRRQRSFALILAAVLAWMGIISADAASPTFADNFADRQTVTNASGQIDGSNVGASREANEPQSGGKLGGHSVWISWVAPADGVATFRTDGSSFDTLLSAYYFGSTNDTALEKLHLAAG